MFVAAPTELVAIPAMRRGAARPAVVNVKIPPAIVKLPPITLVLVPTERPILHLFNEVYALKRIIWKHLFKICSNVNHL